MQKFFDTRMVDPGDSAQAWPQQAAQLPLETAQAVGNTLADWQSWWAER